MVLYPVIVNGPGTGLAVDGRLQATWRNLCGVRHRFVVAQVGRHARLALASRKDFLPQLRGRRCVGGRCAGLRCALGKRQPGLFLAELIVFPM